MIATRACSRWSYCGGAGNAGPATRPTRPTLTQTASTPITSPPFTMPLLFMQGIILLLVSGQSCVRRAAWWKGLQCSPVGRLNSNFVAALLPKAGCLLLLKRTTCGYASRYCFGSSKIWKCVGPQIAAVKATCVSLLCVCVHLQGWPTVTFPRTLGSWSTHRECERMPAPLVANYCLMDCWRQNILQLNCIYSVRLHFGTHRTNTQNCWLHVYGPHCHTMTTRPGA